MSAEIRRDDIVDLTKDFIRIPSVTGDKESIEAVLNRAKAELDGYTCEEFIEPTSGTKSLLFFNTSERPEKFRVLLNGHLDVVKADLESQYTPYEEDGKLYGRGASDMKGGAAIELLVFKHLAKNLPYPIALQLATDEEVGGFNGTGYQVQEGVRASFVISGESTELDINNERKGVLVLDVTTTGNSGHAAYLQRADNAVLKMVKLVDNLLEEYPIPKDDEEWTTTVNVAYINTPNEAHNKVPAEAIAKLDFRHVQSDTKEDLLKNIKRLSPEGTEIRIDKQGVAPYVDPNDPDIALLAQSIKKVTGRSPEYIRKAGSSDSRHFSEVGSTAIDFGPRGDGLHSKDEFGYIDSYEQYAEILARFLTSIK